MMMELNFHFEMMLMKRFECYMVYNFVFRPAQTKRSWLSQQNF
jgi:hypothetical protein